MGEGITFEDSVLIMDDFMVDADALINYMQQTNINKLYSNPYGNNRIIIK